MTIEFNCPYCTALIRVPDNAGGGKGRCPKCATRISVPKVSPLKLAAPPADDEPVLFAPPPAADSPFAPTAASPVTAADAITFGEAGPETNEAAAPSGPLDIFAAPARPPGAFPTATPRQPVHPTSVAARLRKKKSGGAWLIPFLFGLIACGVGGWFAWPYFLTEQLGGELVAETADSLELPPGLVAKSSIRHSSSEVEAVLADLEKSPEPLLSTLMQVQLRGSSNGLLVHLNAGPKTRFYRIAVRDNAPLTSYLSKHAAELEEQRMQDIERTGTAFFTEYRRVVAKQADKSSLTGFRNTLALPALVRGLGHQLVANYGRTAYPCVYEDHEGAVYFLLPPDAREFEITGRKHADGTVMFPASYKIKVAGEIKVPAKKAEEPAGKLKDKQKPAAKEGEVSEEKMDSKDAAMKKGE